MLIEPDYRGYRIQVEAELVDGAWNASVRILRWLSDEKPHIERAAGRRPERPSTWP